MVKKAVVIGINYSGKDYALRGCINDAKNLQSELMVNWGYQRSNTRLMIDTSPKDLVPTRENIIKSIDWLVEGVNTGDHLWFSYSGHGDQVTDTHNIKQSGKDDTICPIDFEATSEITDDVLRKILVDKIPRGVQLFCCFDSCHSGTVLDLKYTVKTNKPTKQGIDMSVVYQPNIRISNCDVVCLSGCRDEQTSADAYINGKSSGALTWAFLQTLSQNRGKPLQYGDLLYSVTTEVKKGGYEQVPQMSFGKDMSHTHIVVDL